MQKFKRSQRITGKKENCHTSGSAKGQHSLQTTITPIAAIAAKRRCAHKRPATRRSEKAERRQKVNHVSVWRGHAAHPASVTIKAQLGKPKKSTQARKSAQRGGSTIKRFNEYAHTHMAASRRPSSASRLVHCCAPPSHPSQESPWPANSKAGRTVLGPYTAQANVLHRSCT